MSAAWLTPSIQAISLPSHAQTSPASPPPPPPDTPPPAVDTPPPVPSGSQQFLVSGTFTVPENVTQITITAQGSAGGGGAGGNAGENDTGGSGGNGSIGESQVQAVSLSSGDVLDITIGEGGAGGQPYTATRRASGGKAGEPGGDTIVTGPGLSVVAQGGRGGGGGGGVVGASEAGNPSGAWVGNDGQDGSDGGQGGLGLNKTSADSSRSGEDATGGIAIGPGGGAGGSGALRDAARVTYGGAGASGEDGQVTISW